ncbi:hypothetical protein QBC47DRAFT_375736 [Echria macrotheca]|uniref:Uncharacterized protein n=1 Tax=Echria macrotheca TaxID=438768 RepID=A0AAJ0BFI7_9PEZI|nr:hypothetical protein QBC47DRAFT_375736 [Echria macrotheca]
MPPLPSRPSINGLQAALSACTLRTTTLPAAASSIWAVRQRAAPSGSRSVSTANTDAPAAAAKPPVFPPESPKFIHIPEVPQSSEDRRAKLKGHLPIPRKIFPRRDGDRKIQPEHLERTAALSASEKAGLAPRSENEARRRLYAASRRAALEQGLKGLWERTQQRDQRRIGRNVARRRRNKAAAVAPEAADDVLTRSTVMASTALNTAVLPDPQRFDKAEEAARLHAERMALKAERRRDALQRLYVAAGDFIVDEKELEERIEAVFDPKFFERNMFERGESIWDTKNVPITVAEALGKFANASAREKDVGLHVKTDWVQSTERQKELAEELTGSKL